MRTQRHDLGAIMSESGRVAELSAMDVRRVQICDVTLRDGGYLNEHSWSLSDAIELVRASVSAGIDHVEVGYLSADADDEDAKARPAAYCPPDYLRRCSPRCRRQHVLRGGVLAHPGRPRRFCRGTAVQTAIDAMEAADRAAEEARAAAEMAGRAALDVRAVTAPHVM
ncbi:hypothetical protein ACRAKI_21605 [Saccharothrix isguenensis]